MRASGRDTGVGSSIGDVVEDLDNSMYVPSNSIVSLGEEALVARSLKAVTSARPSDNAKVVPLEWVQPDADAEPVMRSDDGRDLVEGPPAVILPSEPTASAIPAVASDGWANGDELPVHPEMSQGPAEPARDTSVDALSPQHTVVSFVNVDSPPARSPTGPVSTDVVVQRTVGDVGEAVPPSEGADEELAKGTRLRLWLWSALTTFSMLQVRCSAMAFVCRFTLARVKPGSITPLVVIDA